MKIKRFKIQGLLGLLLILILLSSWNKTSINNSLNHKNSNEDDFKINLIDEDHLLNEDVANTLITTFYDAYPKMVNKYNPKAPKTIPVTIDGSYDGVAYADKGAITISAEWLKNHPKDTDLLVHELMHLVQSYTSSNIPFWLTEGIADFVRDEFGVNNKTSGWKLSSYVEGQKFTDAYRTTASFLRWITQNYDESFVVKMDENLRGGTYSEDLWKKFTGSNVSDLWMEYSKK